MRLKDQYKKEVIKKMQEKFSFVNIFEVPKIEKAVINAGIGRFSKDKLYIKNVVDSLTAITGQKPILTKARQSISSFKIREGMVVGVSVVLRGDRMYDFLEKLIKITFPRVRDFRGILEKNVDRSGNLNIGIKEHIAFPEIRADQADNIFGLEIAIVTSAKNHKHGLELFKFLGFPFKKEN